MDYKISTWNDIIFLCKERMFDKYVRNIYIESIPLSILIKIIIHKDFIWTFINKTLCIKYETSEWKEPFWETIQIDNSLIFCSHSLFHYSREIVSKMEP